MKNRVKELREAKGWTQADLGDAIGVQWQTISRIENSHTRIMPKREIPLADALGVEPDDLYRNPDATDEPSSAEVPIMGYLGAGAEVEPDFEQVPPEGLDQVLLPFPVPDDMVAFIVSGISMMPVFRPGTVIVVYREQKKPIESFYGMEAAVRTAEGRRFIKTITKGSRPGTVTLTSWNDPMPIEDQKLEWIGEIFAVLPPAALRKVERQGGIQGQLGLKTA
jgi:repressor LexA